MSFTIVGLTGPTGAGKTTVLHVLEEMGAAVLDCDAIYHDLTRSSQPMRQALEQRFGSDIYDLQGTLQRKVLGAKVFGDPQALEELNAITHRYIHLEIQHRLNQAREAGKEVAVVAQPETRIGRIMARDGIDEGYARKRVEAQKPVSFFESHCQYTLHNDGDDPGQLKAEATALFDHIFHR